MSDGRTKIAALLDLSKVDAAAARANAEKKVLETELLSRRAALQKGEVQLRERARIAEERRARVQKEQSAIRDERERLTQRRKALGTLNNYKLQQAAEREVQYAARELVKREEVLNAMTKEWESAATELKTLEESVQKLRADGELRQGQILDGVRGLETRIAELTGERRGLASSVEPATLSLYDRIRTKYPTDALTTLNGQSCAGCFIQVSPKLVVEVLRGESIVRCNGCGRILYGDVAVAAGNAA